VTAHGTAVRESFVHCHRNSGDIAALAGLVATAKQHIDGGTMTHEIDTESRTMVDTHFRDAFAYRLAIPAIAQGGLRQPVQYPRLGLLIFQAIQPIGKDG
jgi:hypothetical protein